METFLHLFDAIPTWSLVCLGVTILFLVACRLLISRGQRIYASKCTVLGYRHTIWVNAVGEARPVVVVTPFPLPTIQLEADELKIACKDGSTVIIRPSQIFLADINTPIYGIPHE